MSERELNAILLDMLEATRRIESFTAGMTFPQFQEDVKTQDAVLRNLEVLGEAAKYVPKDIQDQYHSLPWREMAGTRDRLIHHYFGVNLDIVWGIVELELPSLKAKLEEMLGGGK